MTDTEYADSFLTLHRDDDFGYILVRTALRASPKRLIAAYDALAMQKKPAWSSSGLLYDTRYAPHADPDALAAINVARNLLFGEFAALAVLFRSAVSQLQFTRSTRTGMPPHAAFSSFGDARLFLIEHVNVKRGEEASR